MSFPISRVNQLNDERLKQINPTVAAKVRKIIALAAAQGFTLLVVQGLRTIAEQNALFAQGRTKKGKIVTNARGGQSWHNYGLAVDFAFVTNGEVDWSDALYRKIGGWAKTVGLEWGGAWHSIVDLPHVQQINGMKTADALAIYNKSGLSAIWEKFS
jgi:peptidoglycan L-alanyl-D-glutamate endopeptidase CwlK